MSAEQPGTPAASTPPDVAAAATIDLSGGEETPVAAAGRIIGGLITMIVGGVVAIALFVAYVGGAFIPAITDWVELLGDFLLYAAAIAAGIAITGFTIMRRGRKVRAAEAAESAAIMTKLRAAGALDGTATPDQISAALDDTPRTGDMDPSMQKPLPGPADPGRETHL
jgi:TM2 domain-containing membrane protein YozV